MKSLILSLVLVASALGGDPALLARKVSNFGGNSDIPIGIIEKNSHVFVWGLYDNNQAPPATTMYTAFKKFRSDFSEENTMYDSGANWSIARTALVLDDAYIVSSTRDFFTHSSLMFFDTNGTFKKEVLFDKVINLDDQTDTSIFAIAPLSGIFYKLDFSGKVKDSWNLGYTMNANTKVRHSNEFVWIYSYYNNGKNQVFAEKRNLVTGESIWKYETDGIRGFGCLDDSGNSYLALSKYSLSSTGSGLLKYELVKIDADGKKVWDYEWFARETELARYETWANAIAVSSSKNLVVMGGDIEQRENEHSGDRSAYLAGFRIDSGIMVWKKEWDYGSRSITSVDDIKFDGENNLLVLSHSYFGGTPSPFYLERYRVDAVLSTPNEPGAIPSSFSLSQNYPNPFNPSTAIRFAIPERSFVNVAVYDILGRTLATLVNETVSAGEKEVKFDASNLPSGTYLCRMTARAENGTVFSDTKKMVLMK